MPLFVNLLSLPGKWLSHTPYKSRDFRLKRKRLSSPKPFFPSFSQPDVLPSSFPQTPNYPKNRETRRASRFSETKWNWLFHRERSTRKRQVSQKRQREKSQGKGILPNEDFAEIAGASAVNELLGGGQLQVHVAVGGHQKALVFVAPFELNHHGFAR